MGFPSFNIYDKTDSAGILLEPGIIQTLPRGISVAAWLWDARIRCAVDLPISASLFHLSSGSFPEALFWISGVLFLGPAAVSVRSLRESHLRAKQTPRFPSQAGRLIQHREAQRNTNLAFLNAKKRSSPSPLSDDRFFSLFFLFRSLPRNGFRPPYPRIYLDSVRWRNDKWFPILSTQKSIRLGGVEEDLSLRIKLQKRPHRNRILAHIHSVIP